MITRVECTLTLKLLLPGLGGLGIRTHQLEDKSGGGASTSGKGSRKEDKPPAFFPAGPSLNSDCSKPVKLWQCPTNKSDWDDIKMQAKNLAKMGWRYINTLETLHLWHILNSL